MTECHEILKCCGIGTLFSLQVSLAVLDSASRRGAARCRGCWHGGHYQRMRNAHGLGAACCRAALSPWSLFNWVIRSRGLEIFGISQREQLKAGEGNGTKGEVKGNQRRQAGK